MPSIHTDKIQKISKEMVKEWDYIQVKSGFGVNISTFTPCRIKFKDDVELKIPIFHKVLKNNGYKPVNSDPTYREDNKNKKYYDSHIEHIDSGNKFSILLYQGNNVRIYPVGDYMPTIKELSKFLQTLSIGFNSEIKDCEC